MTRVTADRRGGIVDMVDKIWLSPGNHDWLWKVSLFDGEAQLAVCRRESEGIPLEYNTVMQPLTMCKVACSSLLMR